MTMSLASLILLLVIAAVCGAIGKAIAGGSRGGLIVSIALGFVGTLVGPWVAGQLGLSEPFNVSVGGQTFGVLWSIIGAAIFVALIHLISRQAEMVTAHRRSKTDYSRSLAMKSTILFSLLLAAAAFWSGQTARAADQDVGRGDVITAIPFDTIPAGVNLVSGSIGLQGSVDVAGDLSLAGSLQFADGSFQSTAAEPEFSTTVLVSPVALDPLASGQALRDALAEIVDAGPTKPYVIKLEPGIYDVQSVIDGNSLMMKSWVSIEGSDETTTEIRSGGGTSIFEGAVVTADFTELRRLTVRNIGGDRVAIAIFAASNFSAVNHLTAIASGGSEKNYGIRIAGLADRVRLFDVVATASGGDLTFGVSMKDITKASLEKVTARADGPGEAIAFYVLNQSSGAVMTVVFDNVVGEADGGTLSSALQVVGGRVIMSLHRSELSSHDAALNVGVHIQSNDLSSLEIVETTITATGPESYGIRKSTRPELRLDHARVMGETHSLFNEAGPEFKVGATRLGGGPASGTFTCVGAYNDDYDALATDCIALAP